MTFWIIFCILTDWYEKPDVCFMLPLIFKMLERCSKCKMFKMQNSSEINLSFSRKLFFMFHCFFCKAFQKFYIVFFRFVELFYTKISLLSVYAFISLFFLNLVRNCKWVIMALRKFFITSCAWFTAMKFSIKDFFSKCDQIRRKSLMENFIFCAVIISQFSFKWARVFNTKYLKLSNSSFSKLVKDFFNVSVLNLLLLKFMQFT